MFTRIRAARSSFFGRLMAVRHIADLHRRQVSTLVALLSCVGIASTAYVVGVAARDNYADKQASSTSLCVPNLHQPLPMPAIDQLDAGLTITELPNVFYTVYGHSEREIQVQIASCSGISHDSNQFAAVAQYAIAWSYEVRQHNSVCSLSNVKVAMDTKVTYPKLGNTDTVDQSVLKKWQSISDSLIHHEQEHVTLNHLYAQRVLELLQTTNMTCVDVNQTVNGQVDDLLAQLDNEHAVYDLRTNHGESEGAHFN